VPIDREPSPAATLPLVPIAHARRLPNGTWVEPHLLSQHLERVAVLAECFGSQFGNGDWGYLAGLWHDLGKYKRDFQDFIREATGYERDHAADGGSGKVDHTAAGAVHATERLGPKGRILAYPIAGHHSGLPDWYKLDAPGRALSDRLSDRSHLDSALAGGPPNALLQGRPLLSDPCRKVLDERHAHLWVRMLFSCLVDADFLDTEEYMDPARACSRPGRSVPNLSALKVRYDAYMASKQANAPPTRINALRRTILEDCRAGADSRPGFFSLTVPTGGGKTLSSMAFALDHALRHGKRRIVVAIPYTSIIEQTAEVLRDVFGDDAVLEHHSNLDPARETMRSRLATENWDAPIVVTTNVQMFESLFASRTSACRKLHNLVDSVIILDEAQMLPPEFLKPILSALEGLANLFGVSVVLCTATQPALHGHIGGRSHGSEGGFQGLAHVHELMQDPGALAEVFRRVAVKPLHLDQASEWDEIASLLAKERQALCVVNTRKDCRTLHALLPSGAVHLSALMCGEHRSRVIRDIKSSLQRDEEIRVVSTQLVEAGVDLDFPVVYRAMAGLDSIAQAGGRCNREGRLPNGELGRVVVFAPPRRAPPGLLRQGEDAGRELFRTAPELATSLRPEAFRRYFEHFFQRVHSFDTKDILGLLTKDACHFRFQFRTAASRFRLIDDAGQRSVIVWYHGPGFDSQDLLEQVRHSGPSRVLMRRLQRCSVTVPEKAWKDLVDQGVIGELQGPEGPLDLWAQTVPGLYDEVFGLRLEGPAFQGDEFIC
jgi:CRISPR-associated endonuclease/helicase Cas3